MTLRCTSCEIDQSPIIVVRWSFDKDGTFKMDGVCRFCLTRSQFTHTREEIDGDVREHYNRWKQEQNGSHFRYWEQEFGGDDDGCSE